MPISATAATAPAQAYAAVVIMFTSLVLHLLANPFENADANFLRSMTLVAMLCTQFAAVLYHSVPAPEELALPITLVLCLVHGATLAVLGNTARVYMLRKVRQLKRERRALNARSIEESSSSDELVVPDTVYDAEMGPISRAKIVPVVVAPRGAVPAIATAERLHNEGAPSSQSAMAERDARLHRTEASAADLLREKNATTQLQAQLEEAQVQLAAHTAAAAHTKDTIEELQQPMMQIRNELAAQTATAVHAEAALRQLQEVVAERDTRIRQMEVRLAEQAQSSAAQAAASAADALREKNTKAQLQARLEETRAQLAAAARTEDALRQEQEAAAARDARIADLQAADIARHRFQAAAAAAEESNASLDTSLQQSLFQLSFADLPLHGPEPTDQNVQPFERPHSAAAVTSAPPNNGQGSGWAVGGWVGVVDTGQLTSTPASCRVPLRRPAAPPLTPLQVLTRL